MHSHLNVTLSCTVSVTVLYCYRTVCESVVLLENCLWLLYCLLQNCLWKCFTVTELSVTVVPLQNCLWECCTVTELSVSGVLLQNCLWVVYCYRTVCESVVLLQNCLWECCTVTELWLVLLQNCLWQCCSVTLLQNRLNGGDKKGLLSMFSDLLTLS